MPVDEFIDISLDLTDSDIAKLEKRAEKAEKILQKAQNDLKKKGGIFAGPDERRALPKTLTKQEELSKLTRFSKAEGDVIKGTGKAPIQRKTLEDIVNPLIEKRVKTIIAEDPKFSEQVLGNTFGVGKVGELVSIITNPTGFIARFIPFIGGALLASEFMTRLVDWLSRKNGLFDKTFRPRIDDMLNPFRSAQSQAEIQGGLTQVIFTSTSGGISPRDSYNTFTQYNENRDKLENDFQIRNTMGVD